MNDKIQLAAIGAQYRLTEEQAKGLAERMPKTGTLQVIDDEPLCMAKRIEELEAQVRVMAGLLQKCKPIILTLPKHEDNRDLFLYLQIDAAISAANSGSDK